MLDAVHAFMFVVIAVLCGVMLWLIFRGNRVVKFNINFEDKLVMSSSSALTDSGSLELVWRRAKEIPLDWDNAIRNAIRGRKLPITVKLAGRKLTFIVDGGDEIQRSGVIAPIVISLVNLNAGSDLGGGLREV